MLQIAMTTIPSLVTSFQRLALGANSFIAGLAVTAEELKWRIGHGSNEGLAEAYHQASKAKLEQDTYTPATSKSVYGSLSASMNTLYVGLDKLSEDLEKGDINAALADNATAFATLKTGIIGVSDAILTRIITPQTVPNFKTSIDGVSTASKTWAADMNAFNPASYMRSAIDGLVSLIRSEVAAAKEAAESSADTANDFILAPGGRLIKTNPADYLFGTTDPNGMRGGTVNNFGGITIHVSGQSDTRELVREISKELQSELRARINYGSG